MDETRRDLWQRAPRRLKYPLKLAENSPPGRQKIMCTTLQLIHTCFSVYIPPLPPSQNPTENHVHKLKANFLCGDLQHTENLF